MIKRLVDIVKGIKPIKTIRNAIVVGGMVLALSGCGDGGDKTYMNFDGDKDSQTEVYDGDVGEPDAELDNADAEFEEDAGYPDADADDTADFEEPQPFDNNLTGLITTQDDPNLPPVPVEGADVFILQYTNPVPADVWNVPWVQQNALFTATTDVNGQFAMDLPADHYTAAVSINPDDVIDNVIQEVVVPSPDVGGETMMSLSNASNSQGTITISEGDNKKNYQPGDIIADQLRGNLFDTITAEIRVKRLADDQILATYTYELGPGLIDQTINDIIAQPTWQLNLRDPESMKLLLYDADGIFYGGNTFRIVSPTGPSTGTCDNYVDEVVSSDRVNHPENIIGAPDDLSADLKWHWRASQRGNMIVDMGEDQCEFIPDMPGDDLTFVDNTEYFDSIKYRLGTQDGQWTGWVTIPPHYSDGDRTDVSINIGNDDGALYRFVEIRCNDVFVPNLDSLVRLNQVDVPDTTSPDVWYVDPTSGSSHITKEQDFDAIVMGEDSVVNPDDTGDVVEFQYWVDNEPVVIVPAQNNQANISFSTTNDGLRSLFVRSIDAAGNPSVSDHINVHFDRKPPKIQVTEPGDEYDQGEPVLFQAEITDGPKGTGVDTVVAALTTPDGETEPLTLDQQQDTYTSALDSSQLGQHVVNVTATDVAGNQSTTQANYNVVEVPDTSCTGIELQDLQVEGDEISGQVVSEEEVSCTHHIDDWPAVESCQIGIDGISEGDHTLYVNAHDTAQNECNTITYPFTIDTTPPDGAMQINNGDEFTNSTSVTLDIAVEGAEQMRVATDDQNIDELPWTNYASTYGVELPTGEGQKTVTAQFQDQAGNVATLSDTITLDTLPPAGTFQINNGDQYTNNTLVELISTMSDALNMRFALEDEDVNTKQWQVYSDSATLTLPAGDGEKIVTAQYQDAVGNIATLVDTITLQTQPPSGIFNINNDDQYTTTTLVDLMSEITGAHQMRFAVDGEDIETKPWLNYENTFQLSLPSGDGDKTVTAQYRDQAGNAITLTDTITLDTLPPTGTFEINNGDQYTNSTLVNIVNTISDAVRMRFAVDGEDIDAKTWQNYSNSTTLTLPSGDGDKTITAQFRDQAGNITELIENIELETVAPDVTHAINSADSNNLLKNYYYLTDASSPSLPVVEVQQHEGLDGSHYQQDPITIDLSASDGVGIKNYQIDWGDGNVETLASTDAQADHTYLSTGLRDIVITTEDNAGNTTETTLKIKTCLNPDEANAIILDYLQNYNGGIFTTAENYGPVTSSNAWYAHIGSGFYVYDISLAVVYGKSLAGTDNPGFDASDNEGDGLNPGEVRGAWGLLKLGQVDGIAQIVPGTMDELTATGSDPTLSNTYGATSIEWVMDTLYNDGFFLK